MERKKMDRKNGREKRWKGKTNGREKKIEGKRCEVIVCNCGAVATARSVVHVSREKARATADQGNDFA